MCPSKVLFDADGENKMFVYSFVRKIAGVFALEFIHKVTKRVTTRKLIHEDFVKILCGTFKGYT